MKFTRRAVFLDRDGVVNEPVLNPATGEWEAPPDPAAVRLCPGAARAIARLRGRGFVVLIVTNQPDAAKGKCTLETIERVHERILALLASEGAAPDGSYICRHHPQAVVAALGGPCACRKPEPGSLLAARAEWGLDLGRSWMVGDRETDVECGRRAGCRTVLARHAQARADAARCRPDGVAADIAAAADRILSEEEEPMPAESPSLSSLKVKIFADGADLAGMLEMYRLPHIRGFTTNPTLMRKAGVADYRAFAHEVLRAIPDRPISFEVFSDDLEEMAAQAREIATWGENVYVKVPVTNTRGVPSLDLARTLAAEGVKLNVTALMTTAQVRSVAAAVGGGPPCCISVFAGRIADTGRDPLPIMRSSVAVLQELAPNAELIWASPRELLNIFQADAIGCPIITVTNDILKKLASVGRDLDDLSLATVRMFHDDARAAGFTLEVARRAPVAATT